jgi:hypothetical protein
LKESFYESLNFCESVSQAKGDIAAAIATAYSESGLSNTDNTAFLSDTLSAIRDDLYVRHRSNRIAIAAIAAIAKTVDVSSQKLEASISAAISATSSVNQRAKNDILGSLTNEVISIISLREKFENGFGLSAEDSLKIYDNSAAEWFYSNYKKDLSSDKTCLVVALPAGFSDLLARSQIEVSGNRVKTGQLSLSRSLSKYRLVASARSIQSPYENIAPLALGSFHPLLHAYIGGEIANNLLPLELASTGAVKLMCFDKVTASWIETDYDECFEFLANGGNFGAAGYSESFPTLPRATVEDIIEFHAVDAILKSTIRVVSGLSFDQKSLCLPSRSMSPTKAASMLSLFAAAPNLITRGGLSASDFLSLGTDGNYYPVPFSQLSGEGPNLTNPADHSLLLKLLGSGIFTSSTATDRILVSPPFERVYCVIYDPNDMKVQARDGSFVEAAGIRDISLISTGVTVE